MGMVQRLSGGSCGGLLGGVRKNVERVGEAFNPTYLGLFPFEKGQGKAWE